MNAYSLLLLIVVHMQWSSFGPVLLKRHPFSGRCDYAGELLHTLYADSNFRGHRPAVRIT